MEKEKPERKIVKYHRRGLTTLNSIKVRVRQKLHFPSRPLRLLGM